MSEEGPGPSPEAAEGLPALEEHRHYVPYRRLEDIFEKEGQGVFLSYEDYVQLKALAEAARRQEATPSISAFIREARFSGALEGSVARLEATLDIEVLQAQGWVTLPLSLGDAGIESAALDGEPALLWGAAKDPTLYLRGAGRHRLDLVFRAAVVTKGEQQVLALRLPRSALSQLAFTFLGSETDVQLDPQRAFTTHEGPDGTRHLLAFLGPTDALTLRWRHRPEPSSVAAPLIFADLQVKVRADRALLSTEVGVHLHVHRARLQRLQLAVPPEAVLLYVRGDGVQEWDRSEDGTALDVHWREPFSGTRLLELGLERAIEVPPVEVGLLLPRLMGVERERGFLRLEAAEGVKAEIARRDGLVQVDLHDLPPPLSSGSGGRMTALRFATHPENATLRLEAIDPRLEARLVGRVVMNPDSLEVIGIASLKVERAGIFDLSMRWPTDVEILDLSVEGAELEDWRVESGGTETPARIRLVLADRLLGEATVRIRGRKTLLLPQESTASVEVDAPLLAIEGAAHQTGSLEVHVDPALDRRVIRQQGVSASDTTALSSPTLPPLPAPPAYRFSYYGEEAALRLAVSRKAPTITSVVETSARLESDRLRLEILLRYEVAFRGVDVFRFTAPLWLAERLHVAEPDLVLQGPEPESRPVDAPQSWTPSRGTWTLRLASPRKGSVPVSLVVDDLPQPVLERGVTRATEIPRLVPVREDGSPLPGVVHFAAIRRDPLLEVNALALEGVEEIDVRELPPSLRAPENFLAFRSYEPLHRLELAVTQHVIEPVADLVVSHVHLDTIVPREGRAVTEAYLVVRNNDQQYLALQLPAQSSIRALRVADRPESPRAGEGGEVLIPLLGGQGKGAAFLVAIVYEHDVDRGGGPFAALELESPRAEASDRDLLTWRVFVPADWKILGTGGTVERVGVSPSWAARLLGRLTNTLVSAAPSERTNLASLLTSFKSPFRTAREGQVLTFEGRVGAGGVRIRHAPAGVVSALHVLAFLVAAAAAWWLSRRWGPLVAFVAPVLVLFFCLTWARSGWAELLTAAILGVALWGAADGLRRIWRGLSDSAAAAAGLGGPPGGGE